MQNFQIPGVDSEVCSCRHCHWGSIDAVLAQEQDMVIVQYEGNWALLTPEKNRWRKKPGRFWIKKMLW